jgi:hypothetical protein
MPNTLTEEILDAEHRRLLAEVGLKLCLVTAKFLSATHHSHAEASVAWGDVVQAIEPLFMTAAWDADNATKFLKAWEALRFSCQPTEYL